ncbi:MAG: ferritin-like domain-containing protein [Kofleriaceae bacterium]
MSLASIAAVTAPPPIAPIRTREELIDALGRAAEIEHAIMCQYLYAAFSLDFTAPALAPADSETLRGFVMNLLLIARQEMEHLGLVSNLLVAIGAPPNFDRPNLPLPPFYYQLDLPLALMPFGDEFLTLAEQLEAPCNEPVPHPPHNQYASVAEIYERLRDGFVTLGAPDAPTAATLFLDPKAPQLDNAAFGASPGQIWYDITLLRVTDLATALTAIDLIRIQGEGATPSLAQAATLEGLNADTTSHYARVRQMRAAWDRLTPDARAAGVRPVASNPVSFPHGDVNPDASLCLFTDPHAVALASLGVRAYELILLLLARQYGGSDATAADLAMYQHVAFFPLMTMVVRPVGELLVTLPAGDGCHAASFTFELDGPVREYRDRRSFHVQLGERFSHLADGFAALAAAPGVPSRVAFIAKNVAYVRDQIVAYAEANP